MSKNWSQTPSTGNPQPDQSNLADSIGLVPSQAMDVDKASKKGITNQTPNLASQPIPVRSFPNFQSNTNNNSINTNLPSVPQARSNLNNNNNSTNDNSSNYSRPIASLTKGGNDPGSTTAKYEGIHTVRETNDFRKKPLADISENPQEKKEKVEVMQVEAPETLDQFLVRVANDIPISQDEQGKNISQWKQQLGQYITSMKDLKELVDNAKFWPLCPLDLFVKLKIDKLIAPTAGVHQRSRYPYASQLAYKVCVNGRPLALEDNELVIPRDAYIGYLRTVVDSSEKSKAYYLLGHFGIGKTNILHGTCQTFRRDELWSVVEVDFESMTEEKTWSDIMKKGFLENDDLASYFASAQVTEWKDMQELFLKKSFSKTLLICIDEVQLCEDKKFLSFVSMMVRKAKLRCFFFCATADFRLVRDVFDLYTDSTSGKKVVLSPFSSKLFYPPYFQKKEIAVALSKLFVGLDPNNPRFDIDEFNCEKMAEDVMRKTSGHPYFVMDFFFSPLNNYLKTALLEKYSPNIILSYWDNTICSFSLFKLVNFSDSRVCLRMYSARSTADMDPQFFDIYYNVYNNRQIFYEPANDIHNVLLTCGYVKLERISANTALGQPLDNPGRIDQSNDTMDVIPTSGASSESDSYSSSKSIGWILSPVCTLVQLVNSAFDRRNLPQNIAHFVRNNGEFLDMDYLISYLMSYTNLSAIGKKGGWVTSQRGGILPSEKQYQIQWWSILQEMTEYCPGFDVGYESRAGTGRVDLVVFRSIEGKVWKYQIELCANLQPSISTSVNNSMLVDEEDKSGFTVESHYLRQLDNYHDKETKQSAVVVIQNKSGCLKYHPLRKMDNVDLYLFGHSVDANSRLSRTADFEKFNFETKEYEKFTSIAFMGSKAPVDVPTKAKRLASNELPPKESKKAKVERCCSNCHQPGHNIRTCPELK